MPTAYAAARACGVRHVIAAQRCVDPWKGWAELAVDRYLARHCERMVANSSGVRDFYRPPRAAGGEAVRDSQRRGSGRARASPLAGRFWPNWACPSEAGWSVSSGRFWPQKRVKDAIWAADLLKVIRDNVHLLVIGDGPHRDRLHRFRDQVVIADKVHFLGSRNDVPQLDAAFRRLLVHQRL